MRLGSYACALKSGSLAHPALRKGQHQRAPPPPLRGEQLVPREAVLRRAWCSAGLNKELDLVEMIELDKHPHFVGCQFHPEFQSKPFAPAPAVLGLRSRRAHAPRREGGVISLCGHEVGEGKQLFVIAGPTSIESEEMVLRHAKRVRALCAKSSRCRSRSSAATTRRTARASNRFAGRASPRVCAFWRR